MSDREEEFPFEQFIGALQDNNDLKKELRAILKAVSEHNIYWIYSSISTITEIMKGKEEEPAIKCRSLQALRVFLETCEYPVITLTEVYLLPLLSQVAAFKGRKSEELTSYYFQQTQGEEDSQQTRKCSLEYVSRAIELIHVAARIKPCRTVEDEEIKQQSGFATAVQSLKAKGIDEPKNFQWTTNSAIKESRKVFLQKIRKFGELSQPWTEFLLVNLLQEVRSNKKQLLELRQMLSFGQGYLTSAVINLCEDELMDLTENLQMKRKYLSLLNELVRYGDIQAVIMIKNSEFVPSIVAHFSKLPGHLGVNQGQNIYPQIKASKQVKRQFYVDFLRCLENWALSMPEDYDSEDYSLKSLYKILKEDKKFKFPQNIHINRFQKELQQNIVKNKERNQKLIEMLENLQDSKQTSNQNPLSKMSNVLQRTTLLPPTQLENRLQQAKRAMKDILIEPNSEKAFKVLTNFKQNWITYLQALDLQAADEAKLQGLIFAGQKCVQQIQLLSPFYASYTKGKITFRDFKERMKEVLDLHNEISITYSQQGKSRAINISKDMIASKLAKSKVVKSKLGASKMGNSKLGGKELMDKIKAKSKFGDASQLDQSKMMMDRSQMLDKSRQIEASRSKIEKPKDNKEEKSKLNIIPEKKPNEQVRNFSKKKEVAHVQPESPKHIQSPEKAKQIQKFQQATIKKQARHTYPEPQERIIRIEDYEVNQQKQAEPRDSNRLTSNRGSGSKILLRRSQNKGSRLERSAQSQRSQDRKSSKSSKKIKESSLFAGKTPKITIHPSKNINSQDQFLSDKNQFNETIEVNGNIVKEGAPTQKRGYGYKQQKSFNKFKDGVQSISSIHSNSVLRVFNNNAERILDITENLASEIKQPQRRTITAQVQYKQMDIQLPPMVGDYYEQPFKNDKLQSPQATPKKKSYQKSNLKTEQDIPPLIHKVQSIKLPAQKSSFMHLEKDEQALKAKQQKEKSLAKTQNKPKQPSKVQITQPSPLKLIEPARIQQEKDKEIQALQQKIRQLQKEALLMKTKLAAKDNEIRSIKSASKYGSERGFPQFTNQSQSHADKSEKTSLRGSSVGKNKGQISKFQREIQGQYRQYLERIKGSTFRKSLLKLKCLVHKTDEIEIGCMSQRTDKSLECTLYITPHRYNLIDFSIAIIHDNCLRTKIVPDQVKQIASKKQQKIHLAIQTLKIPFCLPEIQINYKADSQYSSNYNRLTLPLCFSKFCDIRPLSGQQKNEKQLQYIRSDSFKLNNKIIKLDKLVDSFPNFTIMPPSKDREHTLLTANCRYLESSFDILLNLSEKNSFIEGFLKRGDMRAMNFLICTYKQILDGSKK